MIAELSSPSFSGFNALHSHDIVSMYFSIKRNFIDDRARPFAASGCSSITRRNRADTWKYVCIAHNRVAREAVEVTSMKSNAQLLELEWDACTRALRRGHCKSQGSWNSAALLARAAWYRARGIPVLPLCVKNGGAAENLMRHLNYVGNLQGKYVETNYCLDLDECVELSKEGKLWVTKPNPRQLRRIRGVAAHQAACRSAPHVNLAHAAQQF